MRRPRAQRDTAVQTASQTMALQAASLLLLYPDQALLERVPLLRAVADRLGPAPAGHLRVVCDHLETTPLDRLQIDYTETFDLQRRCSLYLTYFSHGDTRQRGMALLRFRHTYRAAGAELSDEELPDHLAVVCEFAAGTDLDAGLALLAEHRAGIELVRQALHDSRSAYVDVLDLVRAVLPDAAPTDIEKALALARSGPPEEEVGLEPFGPPEVMGGRR